MKPVAPSSQDNAEHILDRSAQNHVRVRSTAGGIHDDICVADQGSNEVAPRVFQVSAYFLSASSNEIDQSGTGTSSDVSHARRLPDALVPGSPGHVVTKKYAAATIAQGVDDGFDIRGMGGEA